MMMMMMMMEEEAEAHQVALKRTPRISCRWPHDLSLNLSICTVESDDVPSSCRMRMMMLDAGGFHGALRESRSSSRRNAWGRQSYAELITRAIESTPEKRLTLSQIYDWMVRYVPYFRDKGDSSSSAGWKNSIRHNLSLHTRFIRVQNEGTGKSSWWMLNPEGGKPGKAVRRRTVSIDNRTKHLKSKGQMSRKKIPGKVKQGVKAQVGLCSPPNHSCPTKNSGTSGPVVREDFEAWTKLNSHPSSSASTLTGCQSPILAEGELGEPDEMSCSTSPQLYPSPSGAHSPASHCPVDLRANMSYQQHLPPCHKHSVYHYNSVTKSPGSSCVSVYDQTDVGMLHHHSIMQAIEENTSLSGSIQTYTSTIQNLLTRGQHQIQYSIKATMLEKENEVQSMMLATSNRAGSNSHPNIHNDAHFPNLSSKPSHSHNIIQTLSKDHQALPASLHAQPNADHMQPCIHKAPYLYSPPAHAHLPASTTLPPNPAGMQGVPQDTCYLATAPYPVPHPNIYTDSHQQCMTDGLYFQPQGTGTDFHNYYHPYQFYPQERLPVDLNMDMFHSSLDCDMESILLHDIMESEEIDFNLDASLAQEIGTGYLGMQQSHNKQSWVPG